MSQGARIFRQQTMQGVIKPDNVRRVSVRRQRVCIPEDRRAPGQGEPLPGAQQHLLALLKPDILNLSGVELC